MKYTLQYKHPSTANTNFSFAKGEMHGRTQNTQADPWPMIHNSMIHNNRVDNRNSMRKNRLHSSNGFALEHRLIYIVCLSSLLICSCAQVANVTPTVEAMDSSVSQHCPPCEPSGQPEQPSKEQPVDGNYAPEVAKAFKSFFGESIPKQLQHEKTRIVAQSHYENPHDMPVTMQFSSSKVDKALLLYVPHNGYSHDGVYHRACAEQPVFIAGYRLLMKPIRRMETRIRTNCRNHHLTLMLWVKTKHGYHLDTANCNTTVASRSK